ncbi:MAG: hypothetical protein EOS58_18855 [Mesorhizobium sp.]|uniref:hypothetical protein n=1 Tax=unclassified Mesorhizobium TaxID=325217 RepID=UPI000F755663|nr:MULTISPECIES: hypothetical protein [unclassified Mesorhizobium]AZO48001.1 hypothetical protein EJ073_09370 [Mesorhizobium sp. M4B.F.Ca.ET.058.02.1.1]RUX47927.1 hypothetical protein EOA33_17020 [Mesorhizobium sp. M4A.F.Ca.ET.050.02.1.1]RVC42271.1 hypothetical protein EN781_22920 [Mesorhizobium sp. M4A.F.Ca.ET.090.04.2.1]RVD33731.1 hypothetical protein EN742_29140 [Mesorhizobium sp. M4A.F.Ca.ET.020.02.1.1]RWC16646.1 MAG: hypothetical protein EOS53_19850 [Mesorhizobium sp.]
MAIYGLRVVSFIFAALAFVPAGAHFFSMYSKLKLDGTSYLAAQRAYDGWSLFGIVVLGALLSSAALAVVLYRSGGAFGLVALAFIAIGATQFVFWSFTFPVNRATRNWSMLPDNWEMLRRQWEYSHAAAACLNALALLLLFLSALRLDARTA